MTGLFIVFMDIHPFQFQRLPVNKKQDIRFSVFSKLLAFFNLNTTETDIERNNFRHFFPFFQGYQ